MLQFEDEVRGLRERVGGDEAFVLVHVTNEGRVQAGTDLEDVEVLKKLFEGLHLHFDKARKERMFSN